MRICLLSLVLGSLGLTGLAQAQTAAPGFDTIFLNTGETRVGQIKGVDDKNFSVSVPLDPKNPAALATVAIARPNVVRIEFAPNAAREKLIKGATPAQIAELARLWAQWQPYTGVQRSPAGQVAVAYADLLLKTGDPAQVLKALELYKLVEATSWNDDDKALAKQGRLRAMIASGNAAQAVNEAREIAKVSEDPAVLIEANYIMAEAAGAAFRKLVEDNPRWQIDLNVLPERNRLYAEALNLYLFPYLFFGSDIEPAARGLAGAVGIYQFTGETKLAEETAKDLVTIYPGTKYAGEAQKFLDGLPKEAQPSTQK